jgi:hypothetical protein
VSPGWFTKYTRMEVPNSSKRFKHKRWESGQGAGLGNLKISTHNLVESPQPTTQMQAAVNQAATPASELKQRPLSCGTGSDSRVGASVGPPTACATDVRPL